MLLLMAGETRLPRQELLIVPGITEIGNRESVLGFRIWDLVFPAPSGLWCL
jgi:hypothetical protein